MQSRKGFSAKKEARDAFPGKKTLEFASKIRSLFQHHGVKTCLDYGAGKASHYADSVLLKDNTSGTEFNGLKAYWGIEEVTTWEPGLDNDDPKGTYDGVICVDVLEHCYAADLPWILEEIFSLARGCVFLNVVCYPAHSLLPNGENVHISVRSAEWWRGAIAVISAKYPSIDFVLCCTTGVVAGKRQYEWIAKPDFPAAIDGAPVLTTI